VVAEIPTLKFKLDMHTLPSFGSYLPHGLAVGKPRLNRLDHVAEFFGEHPKEKYDTLLVDRFMPQPAEVGGIAIGSAISSRHVPCFLRQNWGSQAVVRSMVLLYYASGQKRRDIRPFRVVFSEIEKDLRQ
jgi:hypothetical protein